MPFIGRCCHCGHDHGKNVFEPYGNTELDKLRAHCAMLCEALQTFIDEHKECTDADDWMASMCSLEAVHVADEALYRTPSDSYEEVKKLREENEELKLFVEDRGDTAITLLHKANARIAELEKAANRAVEAWDTTVLQASYDGMMQERMETLRSAAMSAGNEEK